VTKHPFVVHERVRWSDVDPMRIIRYDAYTRFFELGESELFRAAGIAYGDFLERFHIWLPRRVMHMEFISAPVLDERLAVRVYVSNVGTTSLRLEFDIHGDTDARRATGYLVLVCVEGGTREIRARAWPAEFLALLEPYRMTAEEARA
jgi:acyl-CoA thioester hydrolase